MVQDLDVQGMQQCIMIHYVSSRVMMAIYGLGLNQGDVNRMELGVGKTSLVKVCNSNLFSLLVTKYQDRKRLLQLIH